MATPYVLFRDEVQSTHREHFKRNGHSRDATAFRALFVCPGDTNGPPSTCLINPARVPALKHWVNFSTYATEDVDSISNFADKMESATNLQVTGTVKFVSQVQNGLGAVYFHNDISSTEARGLRFETSQLGRNPEVFVVFRVLTYGASGVIIGDYDNGYGFGTYRAGDGHVTVPRTNGGILVSTAINYSSWHVADVYFGEDDGFLKVDNSDSGEYRYQWHIHGVVSH